MPSVTLILLVVLAGCHARAVDLPAEPVERAPLPPASGTPIGILLDERERLHLRPEQVGQLHALDDQLATRNEHLEAQRRAREPRPPAAPWGSRGGRGGGPAQAKRPPPAGDPAAVQMLGDRRDENTRDAIARALRLLDDTQRSEAIDILNERGVARALPPAPIQAAQEPPESPDWR